MTALREYIEAETAPSEDRKTVTDDRHAEWVAGVLRDLQVRRAALVEQADEQRRLIDAWQEKVTSTLDESIEFREWQLSDYLRRLHEADPNVKSLDLPSAKVRSRAGRASVQVMSDDEFIAWATEHRPELVATTVRPDKRALAKLPTTDDGQVIDPDTGEFVPGVGVTVADRSFTVEVNR